MELTHSHRTTYEALFRQPPPLDLKWLDVQSMLDSVSEVFEVNHASLKARRNGLLLDLRRPRGKEVLDRKELAQIRHFLERSGPIAPRSV